MLKQLRRNSNTNFFSNLLKSAIFAWMLLFNEIDLFDDGRKKYVDFGLADAQLQLWEQFFTRPMSDHYFQVLRETTPWQQRERKMYDKTVLDPRLTAYYGGPNGLSWTALLLEIKQQVEQQVQITFDRVLLNYYRDGRDSVAWHSDTLPSDGVHHPIASVTFGATRIFKVRHKLRKGTEQLDIPLTHGSLLLMGESMQDLYEHHVPKTTQHTAGRINLTFRISDARKPFYLANT